MPQGENEFLNLVLNDHLVSLEVFYKRAMVRTRKKVHNRRGFQLLW